MCFGCTKEQSHGDGSFEYPQHMFWLRNKKKMIISFTLLSGGLTKSPFFIFQNKNIHCGGHWKHLNEINDPDKEFF